MVTAGMIKTENFEMVEVTNAAQIRDWLESNHRQETSIWLVTYKKQIADKYVSVDEILDELMCFGWVDGIRRRLDDDRTMQLLSPRRTQHWARSYKDRVARLEREGRMHPAGLQAVARSKRDGLWTCMDDVDALIVPDDLAEALADRPPAAEVFDGCAASYRRNVLRWIKIAKAPATRARRIRQTAESAARNEKIPQM